MVDWKRLAEPFPEADIEWADLPDFPGYRISKCGRVQSCRNSHGKLTSIWRDRVLKRERNGYLRVNVSISGSVRHILVHRAVLMAFQGPPPLGHEASHLNGVRHDNRLENLSWKTHRENELDKMDHGTHQRGEGHSRLKLTEKDVLRIRSICGKDGNTQYSLGREYGVDHTMISAIMRRKCWTHI